MTIQQFYRPGEKLSKEPLHYQDCGLDNIYLSNGFSVDTVDGEEYLTVKDMDGLHRAIGLHIVLERKAPSGKELRFLRGELDMSQADLARVLGVTDQSVARWEKGQCEANGPAVLSLRMIYLLSLLPPKEREEVMNGLLQKLEQLSEQDETDDSIVLSYSGERWHDQLAA
ncbi:MULTISPECIES: helix-turn-helix domain-containing protein [unclassified Mesorhizobium]|uniref:helix-turn-helix domain-containing protein n=1 Tax=unclassified Mesorhizobium TaxID=325217 RepID=UPI001CCBEEFC|nr:MULTISPECIES: helix-turn-helix domain-containing protein [unclassified Mesorhizobium]MBZ9739795.1 helix-turn-helix domain-containing protein [Mesorhizobium sp. CO1-1-4]MBZ9804941.1 helix-turn-helix domain-containing protein [Mesorhizobium sp. ES1-6]